MFIILTNIKSIEPKTTITKGNENLIDNKIKKKIKVKRNIKKKKINNSNSPNINNNNAQINKNNEIKSINKFIFNFL